MNDDALGPYSLRKWYTLCAGVKDEHGQSVAPEERMDMALTCLESVLATKLDLAVTDGNVKLVQDTELCQKMIVTFRERFETVRKKASGAEAAAQTMSLFNELQQRLAQA